MSEALEFEAAKGEEYERAWESMVKPFFESKSAELYDVFINHPTTDRDGLTILKLQVNALHSLKDEFQSKIMSGKLARQQLGEENATN